MTGPTPPRITVSPLGVAAALAVVLLLVAGFAPLSPPVVLALYVAALATGVAGMVAQHRRNNPKTRRWPDE